MSWWRTSTSAARTNRRLPRRSGFIDRTRRHRRRGGGRRDRRLVAEHGRLDIAFNNAGVNDVPRLPRPRRGVVGSHDPREPQQCVRLHEARTAPYGGCRIGSDRQYLVGCRRGRSSRAPALHRSEARRRRSHEGGGAGVRAAGIRVNAVLPGSTDTTMLQSFIAGDEGWRRSSPRPTSTGA